MKKYRQRNRIISWQFNFTVTYLDEICRFSFSEFSLIFSWWAFGVKGLILDCMSANRMSVSNIFFDKYGNMSIIHHINYSRKCVIVNSTIRVLVLLDWLSTTARVPSLICYLTDSWPEVEEEWIHTFPKGTEVNVIDSIGIRQTQFDNFS